MLGLYSTLQPAVELFLVPADDGALKDLHPIAKIRNKTRPRDNGFILLIRACRPTQVKKQPCLAVNKNGRTG
jgi:hypothetical protein